MICVDVNLESDATEGAIGMNGKHDEEKFQLNENELNEKGNGVLWLELGEFGIDDNILCSLGYSKQAT